MLDPCISTYRNEPRRIKEIVSVLEIRRFRQLIRDSAAAVCPDEFVPRVFDWEVRMRPTSQTPGIVGKGLRLRRRVR